MACLQLIINPGSTSTKLAIYDGTEKKLQYSLDHNKDDLLKFEKIADEVPVYASLRNLIDMMIVAAYLQKENVYAKTNWTPDFFVDEEKFQTENLNEIQFAETAVNTIRHSGGLTSYPTGGGVHIEPQIALDVDHLKYDEKGSVEEKREKSENANSAQWWWD